MLYPFSEKLYLFEVSFHNSDRCIVLMRKIDIIPTVTAKASQQVWYGDGMFVYPIQRNYLYELFPYM